MSSRFSDADLDRLEHYLNAPERLEATLPLDSVQGLFAAVASGPQPLPPALWLADVLGADHVFADAQEESDITGLLVRFYEETARQLVEGEGFDFILYGAPGGAEEFAGWAEGYLMGTDLGDPPWLEQADPEDLDNILFPFLALTGQAKELALEQGEEWMSEDEEARMITEIRDGLADHLMDVHRYWREKRP